MGIFSKTEKINMTLLIRYISPKEPKMTDKMTDKEIENDCCIDFELRGELENVPFYYFSSNCFKDVSVFDDGGFESVKENLLLCGERSIEAIVKIKADKVKRCKIDFNNLALVFNDDRLKNLEECAYGVSDKSIKERL